MNGAKYNKLDSFEQEKPKVSSDGRSEKKKVDR